MSQAIDILTLTRTTAGAITANRFVGYDNKPAAASENTIGVARSDAASGDDLAITALGTAVVEAGAAVAVGDPVAADADGKAVKMDGTTYTVTVGRALEKATAAGEFIEILLIAN